MNRWPAVLILIASCLAASCGAFGPSAEDLRNDPHGHLVFAARTGDVAAIRRLAASRLDLDASPVTGISFVFPDFDHRKWTALQHAVRKQQVEAVRALLESGANPDARQDGATPLYIAADSNNPAIMRLLLDAGADVNKTKAWAEAAEPGGPLWHVVEHAIASVHGSPSREDALTRIRATAAQSKP
jgi:ankyrin repeat protein